jgi:uncharacterized SAM-binding protein YcdF (DUF218 family)
MNTTSHAPTLSTEHGKGSGQVQASSGERPPRKWWGLVTRQERWGLSWRGWIVFLAIIFILGLATVIWIHPFLAVTRPVDAKVLVVEGWIENFGIRGAAAEVKKGGYQHVFTTGGPIVGDGGYINDYRTTASVGADKLKREGVSADLVQMVPCHENGRDRTYQAAVALREWFRSHDLAIHSFNLLTEDAHARRSRLLYEMAFGDDVKVGIISVTNPDYDASRWWRYSEGVREVSSEAIAYIYARFLFHP